jgi:hypothetical protein
MTQDLKTRINNIYALAEECKDYENPPEYIDLRSYLITSADIIRSLEAKVADYEEANKDKQRLVRDIDVIMNGDKAALNNEGKDAK